MTPAAAGLRGAGGGFAAAFAAQILVTAFGKAGLGWATLEGPYGPPFFPTALFLAVFYGVIGGSVGRSPKIGAAVFGGVLLSIVVPMSVLERTARMHWGEQGEPAANLMSFSFQQPWLLVSMALLTIPVWTAIGSLGWRLGGGPLGMGAAFAASFAAYLVQGLLQRLAPSLGQGPWRPTGVLPQATVLLDGVLTGSFLGVSIALARGYHEKAKRS